MPLENNDSGETSIVLLILPFWSDSLPPELEAVLYDDTVRLKLVLEARGVVGVTGVMEDDGSSSVPPMVPSSLTISASCEADIPLGWRFL